MLVPVLLTSPERENKEGREEDEGKRKKKEGRHTVNTKAKPVTPAFQSLFRGWRRRKVEGFAEWGEAGFNVFPFCKMTLVDSQQSQTWFFWRFAQAIKSSSSVKTVMECANRSLFAHK